MDGFNVIGADTEKDAALECRRMIIGPWINQPEQYEGYNGFVGWAGISHFNSGRWMLAFSSGYWHASPPLTPDILKDKGSLELFERWQKIGMPYINAPRGGRMHTVYSDDGGKTWSGPELLLDTTDDDRSPTIIETADGTLLCTFFTGRLPDINNSFYMYSLDKGATWSRPKPFPAKSIAGFSNGPAIQLRCGRILCCVGGEYCNSKVKERPDIINICVSDDNGRNFRLLSRINDIIDNEGASESSMCELPDGEIVLMSRRMGPVYRSKDKGLNWSGPLLYGMDIFDPHLVLFPNGVLACFHGSYKKWGLRVFLSSDFGRTWNGPEEGTGYAVDATVYGYCHAMLLDDGSAYLVYLHTGGHDPHDARTEAIWGLRVKPHDDAGGIEILPAPGSPRDIGIKRLIHKDIGFSGGDPELGNLQA